MPDEHAVLSPSSAERWLSCPGSVNLIAQLPTDEQDSTSRYADEGTAAHALGALKLLLYRGDLNLKTYKAARAAWAKEWKTFSDVFVDMETHTDEYLAVVQQRMNNHPGTQLLIEQKMDSGIDGSWGTGDVVLIYPVEPGTIDLEIIDLKYGAGVRVRVRGNPQLRIYGLGAHNTFGDLLAETRQVYMTIFQPRNGGESTDEMSAEELLAWRDEIKPIAARALDGTGEFGPSAEACRWCPAAGRCRAQLASISFQDFGSPDLLTPEEIAQALALLPAFQDWAKAVQLAAFTLAYHDEVTIPGYKVVQSLGDRKCSDPDVVASELLELGYKETEVYAAPKLRGIGELERLLTKQGFTEKLGAWYPRPLGSPTLVPVTDDRPPVNAHLQAVKDFS